MRKLSSLIVVVAVGLCVWSACDGATGPTFAPVPEEAGEATLSDFETASPRTATAFDAVAARPARPAQTSAWDFVFAIGSDGSPELRPRGVIVGEERGTRPGLQVVDRSFSDLQTAPDQGYVTDAPVEVGAGDVLAGRSRQDPSFGINCPHFYKLEIVEVDREEGSVTFRHLVNPACSRRNLVPGSSNEG